MKATSVQNGGTKYSSKFGNRSKVIGTGSQIYRIQVIDRAAEILDCFTFDRPEMSVSEIAAKTGLHKSTAHRILIALEYNGIIQQNSQTGYYYLGLKLFKLGNQAVARINLREIAKPHLITLMEETQESVHLAIPDDNQVLYLEKVEGPHALRMPSRVGRRIPMYCTSLGKAMLSCLGEDEIRQIIKSQDLRGYTPNTITKVDKLLTELRRVRKLGYAVDNEEIELGLTCVGAAIRNHAGEMVGAISIAGPSVRLRAARIPALAKAVMRVASAISTELGYDAWELSKR
jgi:DNA-binding IclR family transcriptional regulator